jgi:deoxycytidylate deaminase
MGRRDRRRRRRLRRRCGRALRGARVVAGRLRERRLEVEVAGGVARRVGVRDVRRDHLLALGTQQQRATVEIDRLGQAAAHLETLRSECMAAMVAATRRT